MKSNKQTRIKPTIISSDTLFGLTFKQLIESRMATEHDTARQIIKGAELFLKNPGLPIAVEALGTEQLTDGVDYSAITATVQYSKTHRDPAATNQSEAIRIYLVTTVVGPLRSGRVTAVIMNTARANFRPTSQTSQQSEAFSSRDGKEAITNETLLDIFNTMGRTFVNDRDTDQLTIAQHMRMSYGGFGSAENQIFAFWLDEVIRTKGNMTLSTFSQLYTANIVESAKPRENNPRSLVTHIDTYYGPDPLLLSTEHGRQPHGGHQTTTSS